MSEPAFPDKAWKHSIACGIHDDRNICTCKEPPEEWRGVYPGMCVDPEICKGFTHCPRDWSCCE